eukprot:jgi/Galph1/5806/GphlegSOOS_G4430.1
MIYQRPSYWDLEDILATSEYYKRIYNNLVFLASLTKTEFPENIQWARFYKLSSIEKTGEDREDSDIPSPYTILTALDTSENNINESSCQASHETTEIDGKEEMDNMPAGTRIVLPFWMAENLAVRGFVTLQLPYVYDSRVRKDIVADASFVGLGSKALFYYRYGMLLANLLDDQDLIERLVYAFAVRYRKIIRLSQSILVNRSSQMTENDLHQQSLTCLPTTVTEVTHKLDDSERRLLKFAVSSSIEFQKWRERRLEKKKKEQGHPLKRSRDYSDDCLKSKVKRKPMGTVLSEVSLSQQNTIFRRIPSSNF